MKIKSNAAFNSLFYDYKRSAKRKNLDFLLSEDEFKLLVDSNCYYCDRPPQREYKRSHVKNIYIYNGIDRLDNDRGYVSGNCVSCCWLHNNMKRDMNYNEFINEIRIIYHNLEKQGVGKSG